jgi:Mu-like prophage major head subunit gpT
MSLHELLLTREHPHPLEMREAISRPTTFNAETRTIEAVIATATPVLRHDQHGEFFEVLDPAGLDLDGSRGASVLDAHRQEDGIDSIIGTLDAVRVAGSEVIGTIRFSARPEIASVVDDIRSGIIASMSAGYLVDEWREGTDAQGRRTKTATKWRIREASFVPVGADPNARTRSELLRPGPGQSNGRAAINRSIRDLCTRAGIAQHVVDDLIDNGASIEAARGVVLDQLVTRGRVNIMTAHNAETIDNPQVFVRAAGEALHHRVAPSFQPSAQARQYLNQRIPDLARECLRRRGESVVGLGGPELVTRALHTTSDFPLILADTVGRTLRASYAAAPSGIRQLARETTAADFRTKHRLMFDSSGVTLEKVNEHGEFKSGTMAEGEETYAISTFGRIFGITRQALVNDDVGAFTDLARRLGNAAAAFEAQSLADLLVQGAGLGPLMKDGQRLFHTTHGNVAGTGAAPSETTLSAARLAMRKQTGLGGGLIDVTPFAVLVPSDLETTTEKVLSAIQAAKTDDVNPFTSLRLVVEPRFTSATRWYTVANPATADGLEFAYLAGATGPQVESQAGFKVDGVEIRVRLDWGAGFIDHRGWYTNAGA